MGSMGVPMSFYVETRKTFIDNKHCVCVCGVFKGSDKRMVFVVPPT